MQHLESAGSDFPDQLRPRIPAFVERLLIYDAPEKSMLRDRQQDAAIWLYCAMQLAQDLLIFFDVLQDVECANHIEFRFEGNSPRIHLIQSSFR